MSTPAFRRPTRIVAILLVSGLAGAALVLGWPGSHRRPVAAETGLPGGRLSAGPLLPGPSAGGRTDAGRTGRPTGKPPATGSAAGAPVVSMSADRLAAVLAALDAVRERAFGERRPELLAEVYASSALLAADTEQLISTVPVGCRLVGVRTGYHDPRPVVPAGSPPAESLPAGNPSAEGPQAGSWQAGSSQAGSSQAGSSPAGARSVAVTVTATLPPATLSCAGAVRSRTRPAGPTRLRLLLIDTGAGWRIASQRLG